MGVRVPHQVRRAAACHGAGPAHGCGAGDRRRADLRPRLRPGLLHGGARRRHCRSEPGRGARHGSGSAGHRVRGGRDRRPGQPRGRPGGRADRERPENDHHPVLGGIRACGAVPDRRDRAPHPAHRPLWEEGVKLAVPILIVLALVPVVASTYQTQLLTYGLTLAIAALGFNLLLGYTGLLSFGHSAYFGAGAYAVALMMRYLGVSSMELFLLGGIVCSAALAALFGVVCVRHTRIFFAILTLALSQVLWTLAYKFFWITGGTDGLRVPFSKLTLLGGLIGFPGADAFARFISFYYYYVLVVFCVCTALMWLIVHSPFGKTLQAIRDNETRARFLGVRIWRYRWLAFLVSGIFTGLAGTLWVPLNGLTTPDVLYWPQSGKIVFFAVLGGFRNFSGPIVGAVLFNYLEVYAIALTEYWQITLGAILIILVTFLPAGIVGTAQRLSAKFK
ncbi:MAG: branched-chain amino acid ABC transporter permease [Betaproteobacteria bacterium]|nr:MAG: branched-chain amino acid ABC transporter permease [Betaproteobacteria bacterium]TMI10253.1 MAG: branched-chain amino acid ABC transporter permease [Betaproteobacteria bacterium]